MSQKICKLALPFFMFLGFNTMFLSAQDCHGSTKKKFTDLSPVGRFATTPRFLNDRLAMSFLGEIGEEQNRANATLGIMLSPNILFKTGGEVLNQRLKYGFATGHERWMQQWAAGAALQYNIQSSIRSCYIETVDIAAHWSYAQSKHLRDMICSASQLIKRRIAGSNGYGLDAGLSIMPWGGGRLRTGIAYDYVRYKAKWSSQVDSGLGGFVNLEQSLKHGFGVNFKAEFRAPYNYYEGEVTWKERMFNGYVTIGAFGGYTQGHHRLPDSTIFGLEISFDVSTGSYQRPISSAYFSEGSMDVCSEGWQCVQQRKFIAWLGKPVVYMPVVLAKSEQNFKTLPPDQWVNPISTEIGTRFFTTLDDPMITYVHYSFNGRGYPLTYTITQTHTGFSSVNVSLDPETGMISITDVSLSDGVGIIDVTVTGSTKWGTTSQSFSIYVFGV